MNLFFTGNHAFPVKLPGIWWFVRIDGCFEMNLIPGTQRKKFPLHVADQPLTFAPGAAVPFDGGQQWVHGGDLLFAGIALPLDGLIRNVNHLPCHILVIKTKAVACLKTWRVGRLSGGVIPLIIVNRSIIAVEQAPHAGAASDEEGCAERQKA
ncbi:hypothetical protein [Aestuariispira insulae]|uniref:hypothetical protein n=1 Tax=Aestuariispira insulae TaxID=1461337 RepID=UPI0015F25BC5|nr:hypothetical protein [Aestuariispira insulae]